MNEPEELKPPLWKLAVMKFLAAGFKDGDVVPHEWFWESLGLVMPDDDTPNGEAEKAKLLYVSGIDKIKDALLKDSQIHLRSVAGEGYIILPPDKQAPLGFEDGMELVKKGLRHATKRIANTNVQALNDQQRAEHADYCAKLSKLKHMNRQIRNAKETPKQLRVAQ